MYDKIDITMTSSILYQESYRNAVTMILCSFPKECMTEPLTALVTKAIQVLQTWVAPMASPMHDPSRVVTKLPLLG